MRANFFRRTVALLIAAALFNTSSLAATGGGSITTRIDPGLRIAGATAKVLGSEALAPDMVDGETHQLRGTPGIASLEKKSIVKHASGRHLDFLKLPLFQTSDKVGYREVIEAFAVYRILCRAARTLSVEEIRAYPYHENHEGPKIITEPTHLVHWLVRMQEEGIALIQEFQRTRWRVSGIAREYPFITPSRPHAVLDEGWTNLRITNTPEEAVRLLARPGPMKASPSYLAQRLDALLRINKISVYANSNLGLFIKKYDREPRYESVRSLENTIAHLSEATGFEMTLLWSGWPLPILQAALESIGPTLEKRELDRVSERLKWASSVPTKSIAPARDSRAHGPEIEEKPPAPPPTMLAEWSPLEKGIINFASPIDFEIADVHGWAVIIKVRSLSSEKIDSWSEFESRLQQLLRLPELLSAPGQLLNEYEKLSRKRDARASTLTRKIQKEIRAGIAQDILHARPDFIHAEALRFLRESDFQAIENLLEEAVPWWSPFKVTTMTKRLARIRNRPMLNDILMLKNVLGFKIHSHTPKTKRPFTHFLRTLYATVELQRAS